MSIYKSYRKMCPDFIVNEFVTKTIKTTSIIDGYATIRVTLKSDKITDKTLTYCHLAAITVVCRKGCLVNIVDIVVKSSPKNQRLREVIPVVELFERKKFFYTEILSEFQDLGITPTLVAASANEKEETIILQNTSGAKFEKWVGELTDEHVRVVLNEFARFHGLVFVFSKNKTDKFEKFKNCLKHGFLNTFRNGQSVKIIREILKKTSEVFEGNQEINKRLRKFENDLESYMENILNESSSTDVIIHGDPTSNFLFNYEKHENGTFTPSRAKFTNWQLVKFGSPILDLSLFFFTNCSSDDLNNNNITQFLKSYHISLKTYLENSNYNVDDFFSFTNLEEHWQKYAKYGFALAFLALKIITMETSRRPNPNDEELTVDEFLEGFVGPINEEFIRRIKDLVKYGVESGLI